MRPSISEQLAGVRRVLADVVGPYVTDPYPSDVLAGALATLDTLAESWAAVPAFLRWDSEATADVLRLAGLEVPAAPDDPLDLDALQSHHREVRGRLEAAIPTLLERPDLSAAVIALFRERSERFPLSVRPTGGFAAHPAR
jgi:hypothetical protein